MSAKRINSISPLSVCMCVALILTGGFFDDSVAVIGMVIVGCLLAMVQKGAAFYAGDKRKVFAIPLVLIGIVFLVSFWAVDYMDNLMGVMRMVIVCLWMYLVHNRDEKERDEAKRILPLMGCVSIAISLISYVIPILKPYFWENSRISGFFQYANTNGLFFAIGIIILVHYFKEQKKPIYGIIQIIILLVGLLLSGSRSVLLIFLLWGIYYAIRTAEFRKPFLLGSASILLAGGAYVAVTGNTTNIGRIFTLFTQSSTMWGRLLYYRDAALLLCKKFFGLGRMGYYYTQGTFQSGVYDIKHVHNDFLQLALDYGIVALVLVLIFCGWQICKGRQSKSDKELLLFIGAASVLDFHCQYLFVVMLLCLCLDYGEGVREKKEQIKGKRVVLWGLLATFLYVGIATGSGRTGDYDLALSMLPDYTAAQENKLLVSVGTEESYVMATRLIEKNPYNITAYTVRGAYYGSRLYVEECIADLDRMLELAPFKTGNYSQYEGMLNNMQEAMLTMDVEEADLVLIQQRINSLPSQLEKMRERTSPLAYKINDLPEFSYK